MKKYAICGFSIRGIAQYVIPLIGKPELPEYGDFSKYGKVVAALDVDVERIKTFNERQHTSIQAYGHDEFERMVKETKPDAVIITSPDRTHAEYIIMALKHNLDVIVEKPMTISGKQAVEVIEAEKKSKGKIRVAFNMRYQPAHKYIRKMIMEGALGKIVNVELIHNLDTYHGPSYFERWNRKRDISGGLSIHKSCHEFDLMNWFIDDVPEEIFSFGGLNYFGPNSVFNPQKKTKKKLSKKEIKERCPYYRKWNPETVPLPESKHMQIYKDTFNLPYKVQYPEELYIYDEDIDIEDTYSAVIKYKKGITLTYSFNASTPWEGYILGINGTGGRIEAVHYFAPDRCPFPVSERQTVTYIPLFGTRQVHDIPVATGGHGGADHVIKHDLFVKETEESKKLGICAGSMAGAYAVAIGEGVWKSVKSGNPIKVSEILK
ncbi:MAG: putative oxidoreductase YteT precursor [candidate division TA06 bacterium ADurb.Bin131]|uniref:Oxidoreductase YteT n=1 Tax=candidate division TA06 bacterium ADurb.Bin131 TaxID=1852827 RepID=A0A1V6CCI4_UNCT6|nr:MAG: putative oxidoreductase YteT precursor [candidate division TA06 bacterium ADurb.Bin131]HRV03613.1 Gfo/Idh/MocA family oxidoreductase [Candidatus Ratteibacteria bacterium]